MELIDSGFTNNFRLIKLKKKIYAYICMSLRLHVCLKIAHFVNIPIATESQILNFHENYLSLFKPIT